MWSCAGLVTRVPWHTQATMGKPLEPHMDPHAKWSMEQQMWTGSTGVHPLLCSTQPLQQGFQ